MLRKHSNPTTRQRTSDTMRIAQLPGLVLLLICHWCCVGAGVSGLPLEKRQNNGLHNLLSRPPSWRLEPGHPPLPQKIKLKKVLSFSDWIKESPKKTPSHGGSPWTWKNKSWGKWEKEILKNVKALH